MRYNVIGGGDSALYGTESATYYLRNGLLNLNVVLPLAFSAPAWLTVWGYIKGGLALISQFPICFPVRYILLCSAWGCTDIQFHIQDLRQNNIQDWQKNMHRVRLYDF